MTPDQGDEGVSSVVGAILMFGLLVITLVTIEVDYVPVWDRQREKDASILAARQVSEIRSDLDRVVGNQTLSPVSQPVSLVHEQGFSLFGRQPIPGTVTFTPTATNAGLTISTARPVALQRSGGNPLYALDEDWSWTGAAIANVQGIVHLRLRIPSPGGLPTGTQTLSFTVTDANGHCQAQARLVATGTTLVSKSVELQVFAAAVPAAAACASSAIHIRDTYIGAAAPANYYVDLMDPGTMFPTALAGIPVGVAPLTIAFSQGTTGGQAAVVYDQLTSFGTVRAGGAGQTLSTYTNFIPTGVLSVGIANQQLPSQTYVFEYGGVFLEQADGEAMLVPPQFALGVTEGQTRLRWSFPALAGGSAAVTGSRSATVVASPTTGREWTELAAADLTFTISTSHPEAWVAFWQDRLALAGLSATPVAPVPPCTVLTPGAQYSVSSTATSATLVLFGPCSATADTTKDVQLELVAATVDIALQASG
ncbi:MAG: hypothetical protein QOD77_563 [Thermoplasmata archaeon]|jgi:hypothetical protein|nr:hypothetical protein [Thermoplasmata archaeon]